MRNELLDLLEGSAYSYASGNKVWLSPNLEDYDTISLIIKVTGASGVGSTFTIEESHDETLFVPVEHSLLTAGTVTIDSANVIVNIDYSPFIKKFLRITFDNNSETGTIDDIQLMIKK
jgi:hypothetical protein